MRSQDNHVCQLPLLIDYALTEEQHYASPQCGTPWWYGLCSLPISSLGAHRKQRSSPSGPHDPSRIGFQGEFGGIGENTTIDQ